MWFLQNVLKNSLELRILCLTFIKLSLISDDPKSVLKQYSAYNTITKLYECTICEKSCSYKGNLMNHIESIHFPNAFVYSCKYCGKQFHNKNTLSIHLTRRHKNRKAYRQDFWFFMCCKDFIYKELIKSHYCHFIFLSIGH